MLEGGLELAPDSARFLTSIGVLLDDLDRPEEALRYLRGRRGARAGFGCRRSAISCHAAATGRGRGGTAPRATNYSRGPPDDQQLIAYRATALRLSGDSRYAQLHDYERLVRIYRLHPPPGFADIAHSTLRFARELLAACTARHSARWRNRCAAARKPSAICRRIIRWWRTSSRCSTRRSATTSRRLRDQRSVIPTDRRKRAGYRIAGSWSVQLQPGGFHINHVHPQGWLSSAYYLELPESVKDSSSRAGWLKFGEPGLPIGACPPDHFVEPEPGMLVLFPSYMWHGTVPFEEGGRRLTAAFDVVPC